MLNETETEKKTPEMTKNRKCAIFGGFKMWKESRGSKPGVVVAILDTK